MEYGEVLFFCYGDYGGGGVEIMCEDEVGDLVFGYFVENFDLVGLFEGF